MIERIAFVSPPGGSAFMAELLDVVADAVQDCGVATVAHCGAIADIDDGATAFVVVPHEYFAIPNHDRPAVWNRTIAFGVEHPGTATFETSLAAASRLAARFEINEDSRAESNRRGISSERYELGYSSRWDARGADGRAEESRDIDVLYMGTADPRRLSILAKLADPLSAVRTELFIPPHEPMTQPRPDFLLGPDKWAVMARSRILLNLHRDDSTAFEWVRALEAICNGAVVVTEPSPDLAPFVAGEHVLVGRPDRLGPVIEAALEDDELLARMAAAALDAAQTGLDPVGSAKRLVDVALSLRAQQSSPVRAAMVPAKASRTRPDVDEAPMAVWVPTVRELPTSVAVGSPREQLLQLLLDHAHDVPAPGSTWTSDDTRAVDVDVICVSRAGDGPVALTLDSLAGDGIAVHLAFDGTPAPPGDRRENVRTVLHNDGLGVGRARCRNTLIAFGNAPFVLVVDAGDQVLAGTVARLRESLLADPRLDIAFCLARLGDDRLANVLVPELRRLRRFSYLTRGYLVRRTWLQTIGGFTDARPLQELADHDLWLRTGAAGAHVRQLRQIGLTLWPTGERAMQGEFEVGAAQLLAGRMTALSGRSNN